MTPYESIRLTASSLGDGESARGLCPWCGGGRTAEESFIVTRRGASAKYCCHRASCGSNSAGTLSINGDPTKMFPEKKKPSSRKFHGKTVSCSTAMLEWLFRHYEIRATMAQEYRLKQDEYHRLVIPIYNSGGVQQGLEVKRALSKRDGPKSLLYHGDSSDGMNWFTGQPQYPRPHIKHKVLSKFYDDTVIIVEDSISAMKANAFTNAISLHGTHMSVEQARAISDEGFENVFIALDADAKGKAINIARRMRGILPTITVMLLSKDIKDMSWDAIATLIAARHHRRL